jgi:hypothetical protein
VVISILNENYPSSGAYLGNTIFVVVHIYIKVNFSGSLRPDNQKTRNHFVRLSYVCIV